MYVSLRQDPEAAMKTVRDVGSSVCEVFNEDLDEGTRKGLMAAAEKHGVRIVALFAMGPGEMKWDFMQGPSTIGLVPRQYRQRRVDHMKKASDFAAKCGIPMVETHFGFVPESPDNPLYEESVEVGKELAGYCKKNGQEFLYHAGQETPITLLRLIEDVGLDNQGVGLDTANPVLYGKGDPCDSVDILAPYLKLVNLKDGVLPSNPRELGRETPIGEGHVDFARLFERLKAVNYTAEILIEREISGPQLVEDTLKARPYIKGLMAEAGIS
jgi:sugar phosphate isomerase/epimerase